MHVLVIGGCGYIGSVLVKKLLNQNKKVTVLDIMWFGNYLEDHPNLTVVKGDISNPDCYPMKGVDAVIHLANVANDPCGDLNAKLLWEVNVLASMQLVEAAIAENVQRFVFASSGSVYGVKEEEQVTEDLSLLPISNYNKTKMISERVLLSYQDQINIQCVRPATVCGYSPRQRLDVSVNMLTMQALENRKMTVFGGNQVRPNIHVQDITNVFIHMLNQKESGGIFNAGFENISILDIAKKVQECVDSEIIITPSNDPRSYRLNSDRLLKTGFKPTYNVSYAINEIYDAYQNETLKNDSSYYNIKTMKKILAN